MSNQVSASLKQTFLRKVLQEQAEKESDYLCNKRWCLCECKERDLGSNSKSGWSGIHEKRTSWKGIFGVLGRKDCSVRSTNYNSKPFHGESFFKFSRTLRRQLKLKGSDQNPTTLNLAYYHHELVLHWS